MPQVIETEHICLDKVLALLESSALSLSEKDKTAILNSHLFLMQAIQGEKAIYGVNTGFGALCNTIVPDDSLAQLQYNLIRSHACGCGSEVPREVVRAMLLLKVISLSFGYSGVQLATVQRLLDMYNAGITPVVYTQGSLGASGDLAPLAHLSLPLIGEGEVWYQGEKITGAELLNRMNWQALSLGAKEGLALLNGTQFMLGYAVTMWRKVADLQEKALKIAALSLDAFDARIEPFHPRLHEIRPHAGQIWAAEKIRAWRANSPLAIQHKKQVQDPYSFRCIPQIHGASYDALQYVKQTLDTECRSATDNPNIFVEEELILSGGNFHGQPLALALDMMAIAVAELGSVSERRTYQLISGQRDLPPFLTPNPGMNSGLMIVQYAAASIASQNKQYCTPASVDTIPSSHNQEDHVSMGANAATKCYQVVENVQTLLGIELLNASQALSFRSEKSSPMLEEYLAEFRTQVPIIEKDRYLHADIQAARRFLD